MILQNKYLSLIFKIKQEKKNNQLKSKSNFTTKPFKKQVQKYIQLINNQSFQIKTFLKIKQRNTIYYFYIRQLKHNIFLTLCNHLNQKIFTKTNKIMPKEIRKNTYGLTFALKKIATYIFNRGSNYDPEIKIKIIIKSPRNLRSFYAKTLYSEFSEENIISIETRLNAPHAGCRLRKPQRK